MNWALIASCFFLAVMCAALFYALVTSQVSRRKWAILVLCVALVAAMVVSWSNPAQLPNYQTALGCWLLPSFTVSLVFAFNYRRLGSIRLVRLKYVMPVVMGMLLAMLGVLILLSPAPGCGKPDCQGANCEANGCPTTTERYSDLVLGKLSDPYFVFILLGFVSVSLLYVLSSVSIVAERGVLDTFVFSRWEDFSSYYWIEWAELQRSGFSCLGFVPRRGVSASGNILEYKVPLQKVDALKAFLVTKLGPPSTDRDR